MPLRRHLFVSRFAVFLLAVHVLCRGRFFVGLLLLNGGDSCSTGWICHSVLRSSLVKQSVCPSCLKRLVDPGKDSAIHGSEQPAHPWAGLILAGTRLGRLLHVWTIKQIVSRK